MFISPPFKIVFMGTSLFAVPILNELAKSPDFKIVLVVTQPDKPRGRGQKPSSPPIKTLAQKLGIPVQQPSSLEKFSLPSATDLGLVVAYAKKIPTSLLTQPRCGFVNLHGSLLPKYQGASCIAMAILAGDKYSGITYLKMNEQIDKGDIIYQAKLPINPNDTAGTLAEKLSRLGAQTVTSVLKKYCQNQLTPRPQPSSPTPYCRRLVKKDGEINWQQDPEFLSRFIRAMQPWPGAWFKFKDKIIKIIEARPLRQPLVNKKIGQPFVSRNRLIIPCKKGGLEILRLQIEGKKPINIKEFLNGYYSWITD